VSLALARKYRPSSFTDLIGQEAVSQTLSLALDSDKLSHAYLFSGLRGSGKTSTARIFAKALLCEKGTTSQPCNICSHCIMANESRHMDIIEMDAASNRKIDDIRELIEHTKYKPATARYKIFIIDEVHMLTKEAFNALLKTLEEPPDFVKFILATTDPLKLPATILSRTQHFRFRKIPQQVLASHLAYILNLEGVAYETNALDIIARSGAGSVRDALTLLDQSIVYSRNFINIETVTNMLGIIEPSMLESLIDTIFAKDEHGILEFIKGASEFESEMVIDELMLYLKEILLSGSPKITPTIIERFFRVLAESKSLLNMGSDGEFVLSLTLFKMMEALQTKELSGVDIQRENLTRLKPSVPSVPTVEQSLNSTKTEALATKIEKKVVEPPKVVKKPLDKGKKFFEELIVKMYDRNYELGECFKHSIAYISFKNNLLLWESSASVNEKSLLRNNWGMIRMFVQDIFGIETKIKNIPKELPPSLKKKVPKIVEESKPIYNEHQDAFLDAISMMEAERFNQPMQQEEPPMKSSCIAPEHGGVESAKEKDERTILDEPMVAKALELFAPKKVRVKRKG